MVFLKKIYLNSLRRWAELSGSETKQIEKNLKTKQKLQNHKKLNQTKEHTKPPPKNQPPPQKSKKKKQNRKSKPHIYFTLSSVTKLIA